jgi:hypothetical protein
VCPLRVFWVDSGDVVTENQGFSIVGTHESGDTMPLSPFLLYMMDTYSYRNQNFLVGRHQEVLKYVDSPGLPTSHQVSQVQSLRDVAQ